MSFLFKNKELLEADNMIWDRVTNLMKTGFDSETMHDERYLEIKIILWWQISMIIEYLKTVLMVFVCH